MQAIILAAGMGKRLKALTRDNTKCMVPVNGVTLIERMLRQIDARNFSRVVLVVGYEGQKLVDYVNTLNIGTEIVIVENSIYDKTNNIYSLFLAKDWLTKEDTILFESDIILEDDILDQLLADPRPTLAVVDRYASWMDGTCLELDDEDRIINFIPGKQLDFEHADHCYKTVNIYKFSQHFSATHYVPFLEAYCSAQGNNEYYEQVLRVIATLDNPEIRAFRLAGQKWYEIDDLQDLDIASTLFARTDEERYDLLMSRYGGYWRYPKLLDFCYLVNPYFPPERMVSELRADMDNLLRAYPSGMHINSLLAEKNFNVPEKNIVVGNGAAELIKAFMETLDGKVGFIRPSFDEYIHRFSDSDSVVFPAWEHHYHYTAADLENFFEDKGINALILVNPDNPSGHCLSRADLDELVSWTGDHGIRLLLDESFADFSDDENLSLIHPEILEKAPHLAIIKSISKSYGVPGIRLGFLASGDEKLIADLKKDVAIWNINSFAEYCMQIGGKYESAYRASLKKIREDRAHFADALAELNGVTVFPSQANYIMVRLDARYPARTVAVRALTDHHILLKDLTKKLNGDNCLRLAVRTTEENQRLTEALRQILSGIDHA